jgi:hypothetical protein
VSSNLGLDELFAEWSKLVYKCITFMCQVDVFDVLGNSVEPARGLPTQSLDILVAATGGMPSLVLRIPPTSEDLSLDINVAWNLGQSADPIIEFCTKFLF